MLWQTLVIYAAAIVLALVPPPALAVTSETIFGAELPTQSGDVRFVGEASPNAVVTFLKSGVIIGTQTADSASGFDKNFTFQELGTYTYGIYATDVSGRQSRTIDFSVTVLPAQSVTITDILLPPTITVARAPVKRPQAQSALGVGLHNATVTSFWFGSKYSDSFAVAVGTNASGNWTAPAGRTLHLGTYTVNAIVQTGGGAQSPTTQNIVFQVLLSADLNDDGRVSLFDFSTLMFYYGTNTDKPADINDDGRASLVDFSTMMFYWTG
jgi:hypothetical protein